MARKPLTISINPNPKALTPQSHRYWEDKAAKEAPEDEDEAWARLGFDQGFRVYISKEYSLKYSKIPNMIEGIFLILRGMGVSRNRDSGRCSLPFGV